MDKLFQLTADRGRVFCQPEDASSAIALWQPPQSSEGLPSLYLLRTYYLGTSILYDLKRAWRKAGFGGNGYKLLQALHKNQVRIMTDISHWYLIAAFVKDRRRNRGMLLNNAEAYSLRHRTCFLTTRLQDC